MILDIVKGLQPLVSLLFVSLTEQQWKAARDEGYIHNE